VGRDFFQHKAEGYENDDKRVSNVDNIAQAIIEMVNLKANMHIMDFGSGTGLLLERIAPFVNKITAIDISTSMNDQLNKKRDHLSCEVDIRELDLESADIDQRFDGIVSSMTMHHVQDIESMFVKFYAALKDDGILAIADLDKEDGSFHTEDTGVHHHGFDRDVIVSAAKRADFREIEITNVSEAQKPHGEYPVFLLTAKR